uniref:Uncharacterized protein n=1 Tax=Psilocybe cubensis TaxID=181762 RepID=A0A8H8CDN9_PSICU
MSAPVYQRDHVLPSTRRTTVKQFLSLFAPGWVAQIRKAVETLVPSNFAGLEVEERVLIAPSASAFDALFREACASFDRYSSYVDTCCLDLLRSVPPITVVDMQQLLANTQKLRERSEVIIELGGIPFLEDRDIRLMCLCLAKARAGANAHVTAYAADVFYEFLQLATNDQRHKIEAHYYRFNDDIIDLRREFEESHPFELTERTLSLLPRIQRLLDSLGTPLPDVPDTESLETRLHRYEEILGVLESRFRLAKERYDSDVAAGSSPEHPSVHARRGYSTETAIMVEDVDWCADFLFIRFVTC